MIHSHNTHTLFLFYRAQRERLSAQGEGINTNASGMRGAGLSGGLRETQPRARAKLCWSVAKLFVALRQTVGKLNMGRHPAHRTRTLHVSSAGLPTRHKVQKYAFVLQGCAQPLQGVVEGAT